MAVTGPPSVWDPDQYSRFEAERDRAARDLLARLPQTLAPAEVWDLGCGAGQHAVWLRQRFPEARVHGLDSSDAMLAQARARLAMVPPLRLELRTSGSTNRRSNQLS